MSEREFDVTQPLTVDQCERISSYIASDLELFLEHAPGGIPFERWIYDAVSEANSFDSISSVAVDKAIGYGLYRYFDSSESIDRMVEMIEDEEWETEIFFPEKNEEYTCSLHTKFTQ